MKVLIAEKPSLMRNIRGALKDEKDILYTSAFGHLLCLFDVKDYGENNPWYKIKFPYIPPDFKFKVKSDKGIKEQIKNIKELITKSNVDEIIHAGDADREGEVIVRLILEHLKNKKKVSRLWLKDQTVETIKKAYEERKLINETDNLYQEGLTRTFIDWLYGINYTIKMTVLSKGLMKVGRVKTALLNEIYKRDKEIKQFVPQEKYRSISNVDEIKLEAKKELSNLEEAIQYSNLLNSKGVFVNDKKIKSKIITRPKLFSLSTLENNANKELGYSPDKTLKEVQMLYEQGYLTYPRTDSEYLTTNEIDFVKQVCNSISSETLIVKEKDYIFNNSKVKSHSAITPTTKVFEGDNKLYGLVKERFMEHFWYKDCVIEETTYFLNCDDLEKWEIKGEVIKQESYKPYKARTIKKYEIGDKFNTEFIGEKYLTEPPKKYNVERLNALCKNPFKDIDEYKAIMKGIELGTEATRPIIIKQLIDDQLLSSNDKTYGITQKGIDYINTFQRLKIPIIDKTMTAKISENLTKINKGELEPNVLMNEIIDDLRKIA